MTRIYVASSWRNQTQPEVVSRLRQEGHEVYDFRNPKSTNADFATNPAVAEAGFAWSSIDPDWLGWTPNQFRNALFHPIAVKGFATDRDAMWWADAGVLVLPSGRSSHLEAGYFFGARKPLHVLLAPSEPELMLGCATSLALTIDELADNVNKWSAPILKRPR